MTPISSILIVDDELNMRITLEDIFEEKGYVTFTAENGSKAIELVKKEKVDLVLMDYKMQGLNGLDTFRAINTINPALKTIFVTAYYDEKTLHSENNGAILGICHKPINIPNLIGMIEIKDR